MYGTIMRARVKPGRRDEYMKLMREMVPSAEQLAQTRISVAGLKAGTSIRVLFEDRTITAADGHFEDDFRGQDLYQRYGGAGGYGDTPVSLHVYELP